LGNKKALLLRMDPDLYDALVTIAKKKDMSLNKLVNTIIRKAIAREVVGCDSKGEMANALMNTHKAELMVMRENFLDEAASLILRYADDPENPSPDVRRKAAVIARFVLTGTIEPHLLKLAGFERYEPLFRHMREEVLKGLKEFFHNFIEVDRELVASVARDVEEKITPDMKEVLERYGIRVGKMPSYVA
jgi:hypothetical protein